MMRCDQETRAGDRCKRPASWTKLKRDGERERYCTQHANEYDPGGRGRRVLKRWLSGGRMRALVGLVLFVGVPLAAGLIWPVLMGAYLLILGAMGVLIVLGLLALVTEWVFGFSPAQLIEQERDSRKTSADSQEAA